MKAIARYTSAYIRPTKVEICKLIRFHKYGTNYGGPLRKSNQLSKGASYQIPAMILVDVCYRIYGEIVAVSIAPNGNNHLHALQEIFKRRLKKGQCYYMPCLGWKEFVPSYMGPLRKDTEVEKSINLILPSMLHSVFDSPINGKAKPTYRHCFRNFFLRPS